MHSALCPTPLPWQNVPGGGDLHCRHRPPAPRFERVRGSGEAPLTVGANTWTGYEPLYLARDLGLQ